MCWHTIKIIACVNRIQKVNCSTALAKYVYCCCCCAYWWWWKCGSCDVVYLVEADIKPATWRAVLANVHRRRLSSGRAEWRVSTAEPSHQQDGETSRGEDWWPRRWGLTTRLVLIYLPQRDGRLSWPRWLITFRDGLPAHRWSPIQVLTGPDIE